MQLEREFAKRVYHARASLGLTQRQVAEDVSISVRYYQNIEHGDKLPGSAVMLRLMLRLHLEAEMFRDAAGM